ncbi:hypothetical protein [Pseudoalteromonas byunsanensis]|uniref:Uncharacterized protein n=1 Tax=Pseudoalteromonas byunsanensis TaxID=327939 RepID=A0A1S1MX75_9GAMM|nr:hypothetical protein [Pseudoalteromonas byunsanensis]OHU93512.1 hypothetical protein BIW53_19360 [Pseudoalteromonas byunsanensis]
MRYLKKYIIPSVISGLLATIIATGITIYWTKSYEKERVIVDYQTRILRDVAGFRYILNFPDRPGYERFVSAFNQIPFAYSESPEVINKYNEFVKIRSNSGFSEEVSNQAFANIIFAMMDKLAIPRDKVGDSIVKQVFSVGNHS